MSFSHAILGDKVFYRIFREKFPEFAVQLSGQSLVMSYDQGGLFRAAMTLAKQLPG